MKYESYHYELVAYGDRLEFKFTSVGPKGSFNKVVQFHVTDDPFVYNLGFGDLVSPREIDDRIRNDNNDRDKVLATVAATVRDFLERHPDKMVFFCGNIPARTRLYRMAIALNYEAISRDFHIYGIKPLPHGIERFAVGNDYSGFLVEKAIH